MIAKAAGIAHRVSHLHLASGHQCIQPGKGDDSAQPGVADNLPFHTCIISGMPEAWSDQDWPGQRSHRVQASTIAQDRQSVDCTIRSKCSCSTALDGRMVIAKACSHDQSALMQPACNPPKKAWTCSMMLLHQPSWILRYAFSRMSAQATLQVSTSKVATRRLLCATKTVKYIRHSPTDGG